MSVVDEVLAWRPKEILREVAANLGARPWWAWVSVAIVFSLCLGAALPEVLEARTVEAYEAALVLDGYTTLKVSSMQPGGLPVAVCASFEGQDGVVAAGGLGAPKSASARSDPGDTFEEARAIGQIGQVLSGRHGVYTGQGWVIDKELAGELGVAKGSYLEVGTTLARIGEVVNLDRRDELVGRAVIYQEVKASTVQDCYIHFYPGEFLLGTTEAEAEFGLQESVSYQALVPHSSFTPTPGSVWAKRQSRFLWLGAGTAMGLFLALRIRARRQEGALYLITGTTRAQASILLLLETQALMWVGTLSAIAWSAFIVVSTGGLQEQFGVALLACMRTAFVGAGVAPLGCFWMSRMNLSRVLRERSS